VCERDASDDGGCVDVLVLLMSESFKQHDRHGQSACREREECRDLDDDEDADEEIRVSMRTCRSVWRTGDESRTGNSS
jgi:hypothetical protein